MSPVHVQGADNWEFGYESVPVTSGTDATGYDFENFKWFTVSGHKYLDYDGYDDSWPTDRPLLDWTIELWMWIDGDYERVDDTTTYDDPIYGPGYYVLTVKTAGQYQIREVLLNSWTETYPEFHESPGTGPISVLGYDSIPVVSGGDLTGYDFWNMLVKTWITDTSDERNPVTDFKIVFTPDVQPGGLFFKISATNPGQFYMNILYHAGANSQTVIYRHR
ncbi:MAG: hypothetical protein ACXADC_16380 [Candidatus Thorarchaeota archaeon]|jgi:hypothetical protein